MTDDALVERIAEALLEAGIRGPISARIAADVAREWFEGKAVFEGKRWRIEPFDAFSSRPSYHLIPVDQEETT